MKWLRYRSNNAEAPGLQDTTAVTNSKRTRRVIAANAVIAVALLALMDATAFVLLPNQLARSIWPYRCTDCAPSLYRDSNIPAGVLHC